MACCERVEVDVVLVRVVMLEMAQVGDDGFEEARREEGRNEGDGLGVTTKTRGKDGGESHGTGVTGIERRLPSSDGSRGSLLALTARYPILLYLCNNQSHACSARILLQDNKQTVFHSFLYND